jgi:hypothetical protein
MSNRVTKPIKALVNIDTLVLYQRTYEIMPLGSSERLCIERLYVGCCDGSDKEF